MSGRRWILLVLALPVVAVAVGLVVLWLSYRPSGGAREIDPTIFTRVRIAAATLVAGAVAAWFALRGRD
jgi:hypothetical protein